MIGSSYTQIISPRSLHSGEYERELSNEAVQHNNGVGFSVYAAVLQYLLQAVGITSPMPNRLTSEEEQEKEETLRYSGERLQQALTKYGRIISDGKIVQTSNPVSNIETKNNITIIKDDYTKSVIIKSLKDFLVKNYQVTEEQGENFESSLMEKATNHAISISSIEKERVLSRKKRISFKQHE